MATPLGELALEQTTSWITTVLDDLAAQPAAASAT
jgi:hypothetical protein